MIHVEFAKMEIATQSPVLIVGGLAVMITCSHAADLVVVILAINQTQKDIAMHVLLSIV